ncbi:MAG: hypothetical protein LBH16_11415 [Treponema sp.]|jgi:uncharacterized integral membrane protein|nr:hypothetical protein [Treponema sp.]
MPWRLVIFIILLTPFLIFIAFNLNNRCDISFGFTVFKEVPVFITIFCSFVLGMVFTLPLIFTAGRKRRGQPKISAESSDNEKIKQDAAAARERFFSKRRKKPVNGGADDA